MLAADVSHNSFKPSHTSNSTKRFSFATRAWKLLKKNKNSSYSVLLACQQLASHKHVRPENGTFGFVLPRRFCLEGWKFKLCILTRCLDGVLSHILEQHLLWAKVRALTCCKFGMVIVGVSGKKSQHPDPNYVYLCPTLFSSEYITLTLSVRIVDPLFFDLCWRCRWFLLDRLLHDAARVLHGAFLQNARAPLYAAHHDHHQD